MEEGKVKKGRGRGLREGKREGYETKGKGNKGGKLMKKRWKS